MTSRIEKPLCFALLTLFAVGCQASEPAPGAEPTGTTTAPSPSAAPTSAQAGQKVFDPANPPPGWINCHRNHCHHQDGRVASYAQVMQEIGATWMVGAQPRAPAPPAPPDVAAFPMDADRSSSGLVSRVIKPGTGRKPGPTSTVTVHFTGWTTDGKSFDSSIPRGKPATFPIGRVMPGWTEGLQLMAIGEERRFWIPEALAYKGVAGKPQGTLVFDIELLDVRD